MTRPTVIVTESFNAVGAEALADVADVVYLDPSLSADERHAALVDADVIISQILPIDRRIIEASHRLRVIAKHGIGVDNIDVAAAAERGIPVIAAPGANAQSVAEHTLALMLAAARDLRGLDAAVRRGDYAVRRGLQLPSLRGRTLGVVGAGNTGRAVLDLCCGALGMRGLAYDPYATGPLPSGAELLADLAELLRRSDVVTIHLPLTDGTRGLIGSAELDLIGPDGILVNVGRGGVVDEDALAEALAAGRLRAAGVDVFAEEPPRRDSPLLAPELPTTLSPHAGGLGDDASRAIALSLAADIRAVLDGREAEHRVAVAIS